MRKGTMSLYLPPPDVLGFVVEAFTERGMAGEVLTLFDRMRAQVCFGRRRCVTWNQPTVAYRA